MGFSNVKVVVADKERRLISKINEVFKSKGIGAPQWIPLAGNRSEVCYINCSDGEVQILRDSLRKISRSIIVINARIVVDGGGEKFISNIDETIRSMGIIGTRWLPLNGSKFCQLGCSEGEFRFFEDYLRNLSGHTHIHRDTPQFSK